MCCLRKVDDPRKPSNGTLHDFVEILVIATAAVLSDCDTVEDIAYWAHKEGGLAASIPAAEERRRVREDVPEDLPGAGPEAIRGGFPPLGC